jgi:AhpD family alkylhydroperoxidase
MPTPFQTTLPATIVAILILFCGLGRSPLGAAEPADSPRPIPLTRPELKQLIEDVKVRTPRIPMPELTDQDRQELGDRADSYESVIRYAYLPQSDSDRRRGQGGSRIGSRTRGRTDAGEMLDYAFKTQLFWIVSRTNNCQYCLGHQESKLLNAGLSENEIAALDGNWSQHTPAERAAFAFARKLTYEPHEVSDADLDALKAHFSDLQILEMLLSMGRNNVLNRWKEGVGVPQRADEGGYSRGEDPSLPRGTYLTPTSPEYRNLLTQVAPVTVDEQTGKPTSKVLFARPPLESRAEVEGILTACRTRQPRLAMVSPDVAAQRIPESVEVASPLPQWMLLMATHPQDGPRHIATFHSLEQEGDLSPQIKAQMSWIIARQDRAWYALGVAQRRLQELGQSQDEIDRLDGDWNEFTPREQALFTVAQKLAASPVVLTDADVARAVDLAGPRDVVQTVNYVANQSAFCRITEAAGLPLDP